MKMRLGIVAAMWLAAGPALLAGGEVKLRVDWGGAAVSRPFPITGGLPLARGALKDPRAVRLLDPAGRELPVQAEVLAWWPDKSVKWLLLDFLAPVGADALVLRYGEAPAAAPGPAKGIVASQDARGVTIDTGVVRFRIHRDGSGFLDELSYRGRQVFSLSDGADRSAARRLNLMDFLHTESPADYHPMDRWLRDARPDPSRIVLDAVKLEKPGPLHAVAVIDGKYAYKLVGSTIQGTDVKGDCPFRIRIHAYAGQGLLKVEHFFYYEGDGDHDFVRTLALKLPLPATPRSSPKSGGPEAKVRFIGRDAGAGGKAVQFSPGGAICGLYQQSADAFEIWGSDGSAVEPAARGGRFEGVLDVAAGDVGLAVGVKDLWQSHAKALHADLRSGEVSICLWPPEAPPLDFRRHAREWSVGETGEPDDKQAATPAPMKQPYYRLASKGVGRTHYAVISLHDVAEPPAAVLEALRLLDNRPLLWAEPAHYADSLALGRYRPYIAGEHEEIEQALDAPAAFWRHSQDHFRWYGFWLHGNVCQAINEFLQLGRWEREFGRWGWANGDSVGRLSYALMLQAVRKCRRADLEFAERYLYNIHDVCSIHTPSYPEHGRNFMYFKGTAHRHGAWPWACPYTGARGAHPVGAKIAYFLSGEGHLRDVLEEVTQLAVKRPDGGMGDGPLGPNAQAFLFQWEATGDDAWRQRVKAEIDNSGLGKATGGWNVMMNAAFGIYNALEEYMELTGDDSLKELARRFADEASPAKMKTHWTKLGYFRVYSAACNLTGDEKYRQAVEEMLPVFLAEARRSVAMKLPPEAWPGPAGGPDFFADGNCIRDIPFALYSLHLQPGGKAKEGK